ncbi:ornithine carbamoyltransferase [Desulfohalotomaculum tongense]|uniref:ornithine carbamoyltransferase n=1 Tax=Desulforadius tongensis TaxID=1216062 RepID=UPI00195D03E1|nr:ornithine carbamoyltransferase [Desulforadius tongensis]
MLALQNKFKGRHLLTLADYSGDEIKTILEVAAHIKQKHKSSIPTPYLQGKTLAMIFQKASTRTRVSFEVGMYQLGGRSLFLSSKDIQLGRGETVADTARVMSRFVDGIMIRTFAQSDMEELARHADIPVINGLTDLTHPCQILADLLTIKEHKGKLAGLKLAYVGDGNNIAHSLLLGGSKVGMHVAVASPRGYQPNDTIVRLAKEACAGSGGRVEVLTDPVAAVSGADVVVTDVWTSMGQEAEAEQRVKVFTPYQVNSRLTSHAKPDYIFLHCLPAHRGEEVTAEIIDGPHSVVWDEAENRLHAQKAVLTLLMAD